MRDMVAVVACTLFDELFRFPPVAAPPNPVEQVLGPLEMTFGLAQVQVDGLGVQAFENKESNRSRDKRSDGQPSMRCFGNHQPGMRCFGASDTKGCP